MDQKLIIFKNSIRGSWFPTNIELFMREDAPDIDTLLDLLIKDALDSFSIDCPTLRGRVYQDFLMLDGVDNLGKKLYMADIDPDMLKLIGVVSNARSSAEILSRIDRISGRLLANNLPTETSPYISEQTAIEMYRTFEVTEWSGRMNQPLIMTDDLGDYVMPNLEEFIAFYLSKRRMNIESIPSHNFKTLEAFLTFTIGNYALNALGRYPVHLTLKDVLSKEEGLDISQVSSISVSGKFNIALKPPQNKDDKQLSDLFSSGSSSKYMSMLSDTVDSARRLYNAYKYIDLGGLSFI